MHYEYYYSRRRALSSSGLLMLLLFLSSSVRETAGGNLREKKLMELYENIDRKLGEVAAPPTTTPPPPIIASEKKQVGRVFYPIGYGADPLGNGDSSDPIMEALNDAFQPQQKDETLILLPGVRDLGGAVIDFQGGNFLISKPLRFPATGGGNLVVKSGTLRASEEFPGDRHLIELWSSQSEILTNLDSNSDDSGIVLGMKNRADPIYYEDITFRDILFDSGLRGGGILVIDSARVRITDCYFLHFTTQGILVQRGHETFVSNCFLGQKSTVGGDPGEKDFTGTGIDLAGNDNAITDVAIFSGETGVILRGQANIVSGVHCYNKATYWGGIGILLKSSASLTRISNCYLDFNAIVMEDPVQVHVTNGLFLGDGNVVIKSINGRISGLIIVNNMFNGDPKNMVPIVSLDGSFSSVDQVVVDQNNANGMWLKSTVGRLSVEGNGTKLWAADFNSVLVFPDKINHLQYSVLVRGVVPGKFPTHRVTNVSNNVVIVESDNEINGVVTVVVDQYNLVAESSINV